MTYGGTSTQPDVAELSVIMRIAMLVANQAGLESVHVASCSCASYVAN